MIGGYTSSAPKTRTFLRRRSKEPAIIYPPLVMRKKQLTNSRLEEARVGKPTYGGWSTLHHAAKDGSLEIVHTILQKGSGDMVTHKTSSCGSTPLHLAVENDHLPVVEFLLRHHNIEVNARNFKNQTPLDLACLHKRRSAIKMLEKMGGRNLAYDPIQEKRAASGLAI